MIEVGTRSGIIELQSVVWREQALSCISSLSLNFTTLVESLSNSILPLESFDRIAQISQLHIHTCSIKFVQKAHKKQFLLVTFRFKKNIFYRKALSLLSAFYVLDQAPIEQLVKYKKLYRMGSKDFFSFFKLHEKTFGECALLVMLSSLLGISKFSHTLRSNLCSH